MLHTCIHTEEEEGLSHTVDSIKVQTCPGQNVPAFIASLHLFE